MAANFRENDHCSVICVSIYVYAYINPIQIWFDASEDDLLSVALQAPIWIHIPSQFL